MPLYLIRFSYTPESWAALVREPQDRSEAARKLAESLGGTLHGFWYAFGEHDGYALIEGEGNVAAAAGAVALAASGGLRAIETTVLITVEEMLEALRRAQAIPYRPPGA